MNRLDKKQIFIGTILGIILSILTIILLTRNIQPLSAQQTQQKYTVFKTENQGFKFVKKDIVGYEYKWVEDPSQNKSYTTGPFYRLTCDKEWNEAECRDIIPTSSPIASDANVAYDIDGGCNWQNCWVNYRGYVYIASSGRQPSGYYRDKSLDFGVAYNSDKREFWYPGKEGQVGELASCDNDWNNFECLTKTPIKGQKNGYDVKIYSVGNKITLEAKYVKVTQVPIYAYTLAPIFAQTTIIPYSIIFWVEIPEMRGDPYDPFNFPGTAAIEIRPCTGISLSGQIQESLYQALITKLVSNNSSFKIGRRVGTSPGNDYFSTDYVDVSYTTNLYLWDKLTKSVGCPKRILTYSFSILNESDAGVENEKRYLNLSILDPMIVWLSDKNTDALRFQLYWSSRGGPYKVPIQVTLFGTF